MKRLLLAIGLLLIAATAFGQNNSSAQGWCELGGTHLTVTSTVKSTGYAQVSYPQCNVAVYIHNTIMPATIFSDDNIPPTPLGNPFTATSLGHWQFYAVNGAYDVVLSGAGFPTPFTLRDVTIGAGGGSGPSTPPCNPTAPLATAITTAYNALPSTGGVIDCSMSGASTLLFDPFVTMIKSVTMIMPIGQVSAAIPLTIPANVTYVQQRGGCVINSSSMTFNGAISAGLFQIFCGSGSIFITPSATAEVFPEWFGALGNGVADDSVAFQAAINSFGPIPGLRGGTLTLRGVYGLANTITIWNKDIEIRGCGWQDFDHTANSCGIKWVGTTDASTTDMIRFISNEGLWMHDIHIQGSTAHPVRSVLNFTTDPTQTAANQYNRYERIAIGCYPSCLTSNQFTYGIYVNGANSNNDFMQFDQLVISGALDTCIYNTQSQSQQWTFRNIAILQCANVGVKTAASMDFVIASFSGNGTDFMVINDVGMNTPNVRLFLDDVVSEGSQRFMNLQGSGSNSAITDLTIVNSGFGFGNGNTPVDDGACGPGTGIYAHCTRVFDGRNTNFTLTLNHFCIPKGTMAGSQTPIIDFTPGGSTWGVQADMEWSADCPDQTPNFLLGSASNNLDTIQHFHYRYMGNVGSTHPTEWDYETGASMGNLTYFLPKSGVMMSRDRLVGTLNGSGNPGVETCTGTCILDVGHGTIQLINLTGNVTSWTLPGTTSNVGVLLSSGIQRMSLWLCASGGNFTASAPTDSFANPIKNWGFTATITNGTCAHQDIEIMSNIGTPFTTYLYGVHFENGITP